MTEAAAAPKPRWSVAPFFIVDDVVATANFYRDKLGFHYDRFWGDPPGFCMVHRAGITINTVDQGDAVESRSKQTIEEFPAGTGGKAYSSGTLDKALPEVLNAPRATYIIEYAAPAPDGKYHKLKVTTSRKGIRLQAEQGYFANK